MYYVYLLKSANDGKLYIGRTDHLKQRLKDHNKGKVFTTKNKLPVQLVYYESYRNREDSKIREKRIKKSGSVYMALKKRIAKSLNIKKTET
ncbi:MAG: GIY-YIG nuclease family protein [Patescibacteria group bacterium]